MEPIETPDFAYWRGNDGILRVRFAPDRDLSLDVAKEAVRVGYELFQRHPGPLVAFMDEIRSMSRETRNYVARMSGPTALGLVVGSPIARVIGGMFIGLLRQAPYPVRMFATEEGAAEWLKTFR
ncbi:hypothetical protein KJ567_07065 [Candidatus Bipolaricaulota bacterium]|nr:hypothetical protein [Candidatus Bipolaricaulota bacterium]